MNMDDKLRPPSDHRLTQSICDLLGEAEEGDVFERSYCQGGGYWVLG